MRSTILLLISLVMMLVALPLLSYGTDQDSQPMWVAGLALLTLGGIIPPSLRYLEPAFDETPESDE